MGVSGNNHEIPLFGWITLRFLINTRKAYQEFDVVKNLPIDMLIGGKFYDRTSSKSRSWRRVEMLLE